MINFNEQGSDPYFYLSNKYCWIKNTGSSDIGVSVAETESVSVSSGKCFRITSTKLISRAQGALQSLPEMRASALLYKGKGGGSGENIIGGITLSEGFAETIIGDITSLEEQNNE